MNTTLLLITLTAAACVGTIARMVSSAIGRAARAIDEALAEVTDPADDLEPEFAAAPVPLAAAAGGFRCTGLDCDRDTGSAAVLYCCADCQWQAVTAATTAAPPMASTYTAPATAKPFGSHHLAGRFQ